MRGNIFLMLITTTGSTFFFLPYYAKKTGMILTICFILIPAIVSYYSSQILYIGYKTTKAKTYDEVMKSILGYKLGYFSNILIFLHTFGAVVAVWIFGFKYLSQSLVDVFTFED